MKISNFLAFPVLTSGSLAIFVVIFFVYFYQFSDQYSDEKSSLIAKAVVQNIQNEIQARVQTINSFGVDGLIRTEGVEKEFVEFCERFIRLFPDIFAVNFVDSKGIIQRVYPYEKNKSALKKALLTHPEIAEYLNLSKAERRPILSHRIKTYQGILGYTLYVPVFNQYGLHVGFLNVVFGLDEWLRQYLMTNDWQNARIQIQWKKNPEFVFDEGPSHVKLNYEKKFQLLNQESTFRVGFVPSYMDNQQEVYRNGILVFGSLMVVFLFILTYLRVRNEYQLQVTNSSLETSHVLISSLTHDITNPLFSVNLILTKIFEKHPEIVEKDKKRLNQLFKSITDMLDAGKALQSLRLGKSRLELRSVNLKESVQQACSVLQEMIDNKKIGIDLDGLSSNLAIQAESRSLIHNVLANVLTNSIKFSPTGETIKIYTEESKKFHHIVIEDNGLGIDESQLKDKKLESKTGTQGEKGYGFGLMQVTYFMKHFKGDFEIENKKTGTGARVTLKFPKV